MSALEEALWDCRDPDSDSELDCKVQAVADFQDALDGAESECEAELAEPEPEVD